MKNIVLLIIIAMMTTVLHAQKIKGKITDVTNQETLPGVNIYFPEIKKGVVSDADGNYEVNISQKGTHKVQVSFVGYDVIIKNIEMTDQDQTMNFELQQSVIESKEFVVSSVYQSSQNENPVEVIQLDAQQLEQSANLSLTQSLGNVAGVNVAETGVGISKPVIRGLSNNRVLVYSQGMPFDNQQWGDDHGLGLNELGIDKVEIIKGPSSLLYGADAMGGVLHLVAEKPAPVNTLQGYVANKYFTNTKGNRTSFGIKGTKERFRFGFNAGYAMHSDYRQSAAIEDKTYQQVTNTRFNERSIKGSVGYISKHWVSDVTYAFNQAAIGIHEEQSFQNDDKKLFLPFQLNTSNVLSMENTFFWGGSKVRINWGYQTNNRKEFEDEHTHESEEEHEAHEATEYFEQKLFYGLADKGALDLDLTTYNYDVKWFLPSIKTLDIVLGSQGKMQKNSNSGEELLIPDADVSQAGLFSLFKYRANKFNFLAGVRYDVNTVQTYETEAEHEEEEHEERHEEEHIEPIDVNYAAVNASFGATYQMNDSWLIRANLASGFRAPNLAELTSNGSHHGALRYELGNSNLNTENNKELDAGLELNAQHVSWAFSGFYNRINNFIYLMPKDSTVDGLPLFEYAQIDANLYGFETTIDIHPHQMHWLHFETQFAMVIGKKADGSYLPRIPSNNLRNTIKIELNDAKWIKNPFVSMGVNTVFEQNNTAENEITTPAYALVDAAIGGQLMLGKQALNLSVGVTNLLDQQYISHLSRLKPNGISNMGRNMVVNLKLPFQFKKN